MNYQVRRILSPVFAMLVILCAQSCRAQNWNLLTADEVSDGLAICSLHFTDASHGWRLTPSEFSKTIDGGKAWTVVLQSEGEERSFSSFTFINKTTGFIVGSQKRADNYIPLMLETNDGGKTWHESQLNFVAVHDVRIPHGLRSVNFCGPGVGWAVGPDLIVKTVDGGDNWVELRTKETERDFLGVACRDTDRSFVVGQGGLILQTQDGGKSWSQQTSETTDNLVQIRFFGNTGWIVGGLAGKGTLLRSSNNGASWERVKLSIPEGLFDIQMAKRQGWLVGGAGSILHTSDGGQTWQREKSPTENDLITIFFLDPTHGWIGGSKRTLLSLTN